MFIVYSYFVYLAISLTVTVWVARTLHRRGRIFLVDAFRGQAELPESVNRQAIEVVGDKLGLVLLVLGLTHFFNGLCKISAPLCHGTNN